jgi:hypothetical protein
VMVWWDGDGEGRGTRWTMEEQVGKESTITTESCRSRKRIWGCNILGVARSQ